MEMEHRVAFVTGAAVRVGRAIARSLAESGYDIVLHYHSSSDHAETLASEIEGMGRRVTAIRGDLSDVSDLERVCTEGVDAFGRVDLLVNNAALFLSTPLLEVEPSEWDLVMSVNLRAPFLTVRHLAPALRASKGSVINIVDLSAFEPWTGYPHHAVSKAGLLHLTKIQARVMAPEVRVNAIAPGTVLPPEDSSDDDIGRERRLAALGRIGSPEDVVRAVHFLTESEFVTGEVIVVDGGKRLHSRG